MTYGSTVITLAYMRERWSSMFELIHHHLIEVADQQVALVIGPPAA